MPAPRAVLVPMVDTAEQARAVVEACKYPPRGTRGNAWDITRASSYGFAADYQAGADDNLLVIVQIETAAGVANARAIAEVEGVDVIFIGPTDLSGSIGLPGQTGAPEVEALIAERLRRRGRPASRSPPCRGSGGAGGRCSTTASRWSRAAARSSSTGRRSAAMMQEYRGMAAAQPRSGYS